MKKPSLILIFVSLLSINLSQASDLIGIRTITSSHQQYNHVAENVLDADKNTRWSAHGNQAWLQIERDEWVAEITRIGISWFKGKERIAYYKIEVSDDASGWSTLYEGQSGGESDEIQWVDNSRTNKRFIRFTGYGNSDNAWNSINHLALEGVDQRNTKAWDTKVYLEGATSDDGNAPINSRDRDLSTRWSAYGDSELLSFRSTSGEPLKCLAVAWYRGDKRQAFFRINGATPYFESSGETRLPELYVINAGFPAHYDLIGMGNSENAWNSITEVIFPTSKCGQLQQVPVSSLAASSFREDKFPGLALKSSENLSWQANDKGDTLKNLEITFASQELVSEITFRSDEPEADFRISGRAFSKGVFLPAGLTKEISGSDVTLALPRPIYVKRLRIITEASIGNLKIFGFR